MNKIIVPALIQECVYVDDDRFLISENSRHLPAVQTFYKKMKATGREATFVSLPELKLSLNNENVALATSQNQQKVIELFKLARQTGASDIHMEIGLGGVTKILMRINGELEYIDSLDKQEGRELASTIVLSMCDMAEKQFNENRQQDGRLASKFLDGLGLFGARYAHQPAVYGLYVVMRILPDDGAEPPTLSDLGLLSQQQQLIAQMVRKPEGVIILSGPTGSGKSTTLRTLGAMYTTNTDGKKRLMTVEDPPESKIQNAVQTAIVADKNNPEAVSQAWVRAMSAALRLDPDGILVGEIRCSNSAKTAVTAAMTGHLILTTLHANDPFNILERLSTLNVDPTLIADPQLMTGLISQRLVPVLCPSCSKSYEEVRDKLSEDERRLVEKYCNVSQARFRDKSGCRSCEKLVKGARVSAGITGRTVIAEVVRPDASLLALYRAEGRLAARKYWHTTLKGITRSDHLKTLINSGSVDPLIAHSVSPLDEDEELM